MILPDSQIRALCMNEQRPLVVPFDEAMVNPASLDVRLGNDLLIESVESPKMIPYPLHLHTQDHPYWLQPAQFVLGCTMEIVNAPTDVSITLMLKSSRAREGLDHALAGFVDPGLTGTRLTLEITNSRQLHPLPLWPGMRIGQLVLKQMADVPEKSYLETGRYNHQPHVQESLG